MTTSIFLQGKTAPIRAKLTTTAATAVYTCPDNFTARIVGFRCANTDASNACNITVTIVDAFAVAYTFYPTNSLAGGAVIDFDLSGHPLKAIEAVVVQASNANDIHVIGVAIETFGPDST